MIQLKTTAGILSHWQRIRIKRSLEQMSGDFELGLTGELGALDQYRAAIRTGERCQVLLHGGLVIDGYLENSIIQYDDKKHSLTVAGRDITADLVDTSAIVDKQELHNVTILDAAKRLLEPFDISIDCPKAGKPFKKFAINDGESIFDTLKSHASQRGMLLYTLGDGILHIGNPQAHHINIKLVEGINIKAASVERDTSKHYRKYIVKTQSKKAQNTQATAIDEHARAGRTLIIHAERNEDSSSNPKVRADWEKQSRRAASTRASVTVSGWEYAPSKLWNIGQQLYLDAPSLQIQAERLIADITYSVDAQGGSECLLTLVDPATYRAKP